MSAEPTGLAVRGLRQERGGRLVLDDVSLDVPAGTITALIGASGAGKTSLLRCLVGLDWPVAGRVEFEGADIATLDACTLRRRVALVAQTPVMFAGDVRSNLAYGLEAPSEPALAEALVSAGLPVEFLDRDARALSVGQSARVAIARALAREPRVLLLDEPTAALDPEATAGIEALVGSLAERGLAVLMITHDLAQADRVASREVRLELGRVVSVTALIVAIVLALVAAGLSRWQRVGLERELLITAARAIVQLTVVGLVVTLVFNHVGLAALFVLLMFSTAAFTSGRRLRGIDHGILRAGAAIATGAATALIPLLATGGVKTTPRELIPVAGILIGGAMAATSVTGRRVIEDIGDQLPEIEARLLLGVSARTALVPVVSRGVRTGLIGVMDQTKNVGLVTLPGTFVGLVLGGADPAEAARLQLVVLLSLLAVELVAALVCARLVAAACTLPGERVRPAEVPRARR